MGKFRNLGINTVIKHTDEKSLKTYISALNRLNVEWVRLEFNYYDPLPDSLMSDFVSMLESSGIRILGLLTGLVPGNLVNCIVPSIRFKSPLDTIEHYKEFCVKHADMYRNKISHWEIWNESNTLRFWIRKPNAAEYTQLVKETVSAMRPKVSEGTKFVFGGLMGDDVHVYAPFQKINFIQECADLGIDDYIDIYSFHPYIPACYVSRKPKEHYITGIKESAETYLKKYSHLKKPQWISEIGVCPLWTSVGEEKIGEIYAELYRHYNALDIPMFLWTLTDFKGKEYSRFNPETAFGLLDWDLNEKPVFTSLLKNLAQ